MNNCTFLERIPKTFLVKINELISRYNVKNISFVERKYINSNAIVFFDGIGYEIIFDKELSNELLVMVIAHEIGHIALSFMDFSPQDSYCSEVEYEVDLWAFNKIKDGFNSDKKKLLQKILKKKKINEFYLALDTGDIK